MNIFVPIGLLINSALYLACVFVAGLAYGNRAAVLGAIATAGVNYLCCFAQMGAQLDGVHRAWFLASATVLLYMSVALGALAGLALLFG